MPADGTCSTSAEVAVEAAEVSAGVAVEAEVEVEAEAEAVEVSAGVAVEAEAERQSAVVLFHRVSFAPGAAVLSAACWGVAAGSG